MSAADKDNNDGNEAVPWEDTWSFKDDHTQWKTEDLRDYIGMLNPPLFEEYGETIEMMRYDGRHFEKLTGEKFVRELGIYKKSHILAIIRAARNRIDKHKIAMIDENNNSEPSLSDAFNGSGLGDILGNLGNNNDPSDDYQIDDLNNKLNINENKHENENKNEIIANETQIQVPKQSETEENANTYKVQSDPIENASNVSMQNQVEDEAPMAYKMPVPDDDDYLFFGEPHETLGASMNSNFNSNINGNSQKIPGTENYDILTQQQQQEQQQQQLHLLQQQQQQMQQLQQLQQIQQMQQLQQQLQQQQQQQQQQQEEDKFDNEDSEENDERFWRNDIIDTKQKEDFENDTYFTAELSEESEKELNSEFNAIPNLPYAEHPAPSLKPMSNRFRTNGPNKYIYPPKNGPFATCRTLDENPMKYPIYDIEDELFNNQILGTEFVKSDNFSSKFAIDQLSERYNNELAYLINMGYDDRYRNLRALLRHDRSNNRIEKVMEEFEEFDKSVTQFDSLFVGDTVVRGPDWKWGGQDGGPYNELDPKFIGNYNENERRKFIGLKGTVRGVRRWHPNDSENKMTSCVVVWEHGLYGNYRFGYKGAYDVKVVDRLYFSNPDIDRKARLGGGRLKLLGGAGGMSIGIGDEVIRRQKNWRWGEQDGGCKGVGTIIEIYASPSPFEAGAVIGVLWDKDKNKWHQKAVNLMQKKDKWERDYKDFLKRYDNNKINLNAQPGADGDADADDEYEIENENGDNEFSAEVEFYNENGDTVIADSKNNAKNKMKNKQIFCKHNTNPHCVKFFKKPRKYRKFKHGINWNLKSLHLNKKQLKHDNNNNNNNQNNRNINNNRNRPIAANINNINNNNNNNNNKFDLDEKEVSTSESDDWSEPDFDEMLSKPIAKYSWGINEKYDLEINEVKFYEKNKFVSIDDRCERGPQFVAPAKGDYKSEQGIVLRVEQWDPRRIEPNEIIGDKVWLTWDALRGFKFGYNNEFEIKKVKDGEVFKYEFSKIRVGDRVLRGVHWHYEEEDGGIQNDGNWSKGTVSCIQHKLRVTGLIVRVRWHRNNHVNQYSWGFRNIFDLKKLKPVPDIAPAADANDIQPGMC